ncbi:MAG: intermembrane transport protein PqiB [Thermodesulfobacteriota bacterium]
MNETGNQLPEMRDLPTADVQTRHFPISIVWVVPIAAIIVGGWLVYKTISEKGPTITIAFESAEGLEAGKTKIRFKDVDLGQVSSIDLSENLSQVIVTAELVKTAEAFISENTRFWVVRARVAATGVSGLGTLFSGAYIALDPGKKGKPSKKFIGLAEPPIVTADQRGKHFLLKAADRGSLEIGSPVYYRKIEVGQVVAHRLAENGESVDIEVFVNTPFDQYVYENSRFWESSGFDITLDTEGMRLDTESFVSFAIGGVAFGLPPKTDPAPHAEKEAVFRLYKNREEAFRKTYEQKHRWLLHFHESVRGLVPGSPVEFYGIQIGQVIDIWLETGDKKSEYRATVVIELEPDRAMQKDERLTNPEERQQRIEYLIEKGLRARIDTGNLVTGRKLVSLDFYPEAPAAAAKKDGLYPEIPTIPSPMVNIGNKISRIIARIESMPLEQIADNLKDTLQGTKAITQSPETRAAVVNLNASLAELRLLIADLRTQVTPEIDKTLRQAQLSLKAAEGMLNENAQLPVTANEALDEISAAAKSLRLLMDYLEQHPEAFIQGKGQEQ